MNGWWILIFLVFSSSIPAFAVFFWFRIARYPISIIQFLLALLAGAAAYFPALIMQGFIPRDFFIAGRLGLVIQIFVPIAFPEELSRLIVLFIFFFVARKINTLVHATKTINSNSSDLTVPASTPAPDTRQTVYGNVVYCSAIGLIAGLGFAILESAAYGTSEAGVMLLRLFTAAPIHGTCGARIGSAAVLFRTHPVQGLFRFFSAVIIHGIYNYLIIMPGFAPIAAVLIALFSLASSVLFIRSGMKSGTQQTIKNNEVSQRPIDKD